MAVYRAKIHTDKGLKNVDLIANNDREARDLAKLRGKLVSIKKKATFGGGVSVLSPAERQVFFSRLSSLLRSKIGVGEALRLIRDNFKGRIAEVAGRLLTSVEQGDDLAKSFERVGAPDFQPSTIALIKAGMMAGDSGKAITDASIFEQELEMVKRQSGKGMGSAMIGFFSAAGMTFGSTFYFGPQMLESDLLKSQVESGAIDIAWTFTMGYVMSALMIVFVALLLGLTFISRIFKIFKPEAADNLVAAIPYYNDLVLSKNNFISFYGLSLLIGSGVRLEDSLRLNASSTPQGRLKSDLLKAASAVKDGKAWANYISSLHPTDRAALSVSVDRDQIAKTLSAIAHQYKELYSIRLGTIVPVIQMITAIFLTASGGLLFAQMILPMLMMGDGLGG